eukprot:12498559-Prorocentrum_lima.AAC.1
MTSSLVGSEMCIRDRVRRRRDSVAACSSVMLAGAWSPLPPFVMPVLPVSYTHLTLPTICSV